MLFKRFYDEDLAQASFFLGCQATGEALVVDPRRDIRDYLGEAERQNMRIVAVTETHIHADYLSGSRELAAATGAALYLSDEGGPDWRYAVAHEPLRNGGDIAVGNIRVRAVHTPGHTPEHLSFLVTDGAATTEPGFYLTGDFVFVGDVGRPDLLDEAAGGRDTRFAGAKQLFASLRERFLSLPDYVQVWPGHGAGSACGKALGAVASTTVGYERLVAWWSPYVQENDEEGFVAALLEGQPDAPVYFGRMKRQNKAGPPVLGHLPPPEPLSAEGLRHARAAGALFIDARSREQYDRGTVPGALHLPATKSFATWAAWVIDPERDDRNIVLLGVGGAQAEDLRGKLQGVGIDNPVSYAEGLGDLETEPPARVSQQGLERLNDPFLLDVRARSEYATGHIPGAKNIPGGRVMWSLDELPRDRAIVTYCQSGARSAVVASALRDAGFDGVLELEGSYQEWQRRHAPAAV